MFAVTRPTVAHKFEIIEGVVVYSKDVVNYSVDNIFKDGCPRPGVDVPVLVLALASKQVFLRAQAAFFTTLCSHLARVDLGPESSAIEPEKNMFPRRRPAALLAGLCLSVATLFSTTVSAETTELRVSAIPDEAPTELLRKFEPLGQYLQEQLGIPVVFQPVSDYAGVVEALGAKRLDMAWLGGFTFVQAKLRTGNAIPLVQREQDEVFTSTFITADPAVQSHADLEGKSFAFGSVSSTSGHLMPRYFLQQDGIDPDTFFSRVGFSGAHDATVAWVESGKVDAGVLNSSVWEKLLEENKVDTSKVRVYTTTPTYYDYNWTVRGDLEPELVERIRAAFLALDPANPAHKAILDLQRASRFVPASAENYIGIEEAARSAGLLE